MQSIYVWIRRSLIVLIVVILLAPMGVAIDPMLALLFALGGVLLLVGLWKIDPSTGPSMWDFIPSNEYVGLFGGFTRREQDQAIEEIQEQAEHQTKQSNR